MTTCYLDFCCGDADAYARACQEYERLQAWLTANAASYGLPDLVHELDEANREVVKSAYEGSQKTTIESFDKPKSLRLPRLKLIVSDSKGVAKTARNFVDLCTDSRKLKGKQKVAGVQPDLRYQATKVFRIERDFVCQGGDVTRNDGSGGESVYGGSFKDEPEGLKAPFAFGTLAMANSGKNSNTSQWFICLAKDSVKLKKLTGKYVVFGSVDLDDGDSLACLAQLNELGDNEGQPREPVWIEECGVLS